MKEAAQQDIHTKRQPQYPVKTSRSARTPASDTCYRQIREGMQVKDCVTAAKRALVYINGISCNLKEVDFWRHHLFLNIVHLNRLRSRNRKSLTVNATADYNIIST